VTTEGEPVRVSVCHCLACQSRTGSTYGAQARFSADLVQIEGEARVYTRTGESGSRIDFHFCPDCGATVYYRLEVVPDAIAIPVGGFADPSFPAPSFSVYEARRHAWVNLPEGVERHD
jgi:hypothetical protein